MNMDVASYLKQELDSARGDWPAVSRASGVPYSTLCKIAQGVVDPRLSNVQRLLDYFSRKNEGEIPQCHDAPDNGTTALLKEKAA